MEDAGYEAIYLNRTNSLTPELRLKIFEMLQKFLNFKPEFKDKIMNSPNSIEYILEEE